MIASPVTVYVTVIGTVGGFPSFSGHDGSENFTVDERVSGFVGCGLRAGLMYRASTKVPSVTTQKTIAKATTARLLAFGKFYSFVLKYSPNTALTVSGMESGLSLVTT
jgi:hypothetical protein